MSAKLLTDMHGIILCRRDLQLLIISRTLLSSRAGKKQLKREKRKKERLHNRLSSSLKVFLLQ